MSNTRIQQLRADMGAHGPGSKERFDLIHSARVNLKASREFDDDIAGIQRRPRGFVPQCPACQVLPVLPHRNNQWSCTCGASGGLDDQAFEMQYDGERERRYALRLEAKKQRWLDKLATYPWKERNRPPAVVRSSFCVDLVGMIGSSVWNNANGNDVVTAMLRNDEVWGSGGDALLYTVLKAMHRHQHVLTFVVRPWLNVFRAYEAYQNLPSIERAWRLLDIVGMIDRRWLTPNALLDIRTSTDPVASFDDVPDTMQALITRYIDAYYDVVLSELLATARRHVGRPGKIERVVRRLHELRERADRSPVHLEKWMAVLDHLVSMGYTTTASANDDLLPKLLDSRALDDDEALAWTQRLLNELDPEPFMSALATTNRNDALLAAAGSGWTRVVDLLIEHGARLENMDVGLLAVVVALHRKQHAMVEHLFERGVDPVQVIQEIADVAGVYRRIGPNKMLHIDHEEAEALLPIVQTLEAHALRRTAEVMADLPEVHAKPRRRL